MFETARRDGTLGVLAGSAVRWLATGHAGGYRDAPAAYNVTVPEEFDRTDLEKYGVGRRRRAGFDRPGPTLLTGVEQCHARGARSGPVIAVATVGLSNPATLPVDPARADGETRPGEPPHPEDQAPTERSTEGSTAGGRDTTGDHPGGHPGTVNLIVGVDRNLGDGALATALGTVVEAKTATLLAATGFSGTTTDAAVVGSVPGARSVEFAGSATPVGTAARACVRAAVLASLDSRYASGTVPDSVADADHGVSTTRRAAVFDPRDG